jgi:hypothetical protein
MPKQKQKQTQIVNIHLGTKAKKSKQKGKGKSRPKKSKGESKTQIITSFNPPPIINYPPQFVAPNQPNWYQQPPSQISQKQYSALPEGETSSALNLNPSTPVRFSFVGAEERLKAPLKEPKLESLVGPPETKAEEEVILPTEPIEEEASAEEGSISSSAPSVLAQNLEANTAGLGLNPPFVASSLGVPLSFTTEGLFPIAQSTSFNPPEASLLAEPKEPKKEKKYKKKSSSSAQSEEQAKVGSLHSFFPSITPARQLTTSEVNLATGEPHNFPPPLYNIPITTEKPARTFTLGSPAYPSFIGQSKEPPEKATGEYLQRQRASGITPAEESILFA